MFLKITTILAKILVSTIVLVLSACATHQNTGMALGGVIGGVGGNIIGKNQDSKTRAIYSAVGAIAGSIIGGLIGSYMDKRDQEELYKALRETPDNDEYHWINEKTGNEFTIKPIATYKTNKGICREYVVEGKRKGSWKTDKQTEKQCF